MYVIGSSFTHYDPKEDRNYLHIWYRYLVCSMCYINLQRLIDLHRTVVASIIRAVFYVNLLNGMH
jgi:hypothetical protein